MSLGLLLYDTTLKLVSRIWQTLESDMMLTILNFGIYLYDIRKIILINEIIKSYVQTCDSELLATHGYDIWYNNNEIRY